MERSRAERSRAERADQPETCCRMETLKEGRWRVGDAKREACTDEERRSVVRNGVYLMVLELRITVNLTDQKWLFVAERELRHCDVSHFCVLLMRSLLGLRSRVRRKSFKSNIISVFIPESGPQWVRHFTLIDC